MLIFTYIHLATFLKYIRATSRHDLRAVLLTKLLEFPELFSDQIITVCITGCTNWFNGLLPSKRELMSTEVLLQKTTKVKPNQRNVISAIQKQHTLKFLKFQLIPCPFHFSSGNSQKKQLKEEKENKKNTM